ncbi:MAG: MaoC family dehydratase N-terminal domain-containing protein [Deltaproteobacteria bacterium]|nr:MaoC family dehydratase N-terminal domain-containing protein [Deltaproteobacteria bacterium]
MTQLHPTEPIATFEHEVPASQAGRFFDAVAWQLPTRPASPPTLATTFRHGEFAALQKLGVALQNVLHGEQKYRFHGELKSGTRYRGETFVNSHYAKSGGSGTMNFYVFQTNLKDGAGALAVECVTTIIVRS